jgi:hypothetical protein
MSKGSEGSAGKRPTKLYPGEADTSLAMRAVHSVVLSLDAKPGPIYDAYQRGGVDDPRKLVSPLLQWALTEIRAVEDLIMNLPSKLAITGLGVAVLMLLAFLTPAPAMAQIA